MQTAPLLGTILLEKYRVEKILGQGGMGIVIAARHLHLDELFAIKLMLPEALEHPDALERFMREARASARMKSEHVARVHDVGKLENGAPYMVMEHLQGQDLHALLDERGALSVREAALYISQACEALAEAHANGIVHRDLKPSNLFLTLRANGTPCIKVLDFGISKELETANRLGPALTRTGAFMGTPLYMSPEQMENVKATDPRSDIWALGIMLYELATGYVPFAAEAVTELVTKVLTKKPVPPSRLSEKISPEFDAVVLRCLEKKPAYRFTSVRELSAALAPFLVEGPGVVVQHPTMTPLPGTIPLTAGPISSPSGPDSVTLVKPQKADDDENTTLPMRTRQVSFRGNEPRPEPPVGLYPPTLPMHVAGTGGAWGNTSRVTLPGNRNLLPWVAAGSVVLVALAGGLAYFTTTGENDTPNAAPSSAATTPVASTEVPTPPPMEQTVPPAPSTAESAAPAPPPPSSVAPALQPGTTTKPTTTSTKTPTTKSTTSTKTPTTKSTTTTTTTTTTTKPTTKRKRYNE